MKALQSRYGTLWNYYGSTAGTLRGVAERHGTLWSVAGCYGSITGCYRSITALLQNVQDITEASWSIMEPLQDVTERYGSIAEALWGIAEHYRTLQSVAGCCCGMLRGNTECYKSVTEPLRDITKPLRNIADCGGYRTLRSVAGHHKMLRKRYGKLSILP